MPFRRLNWKSQVNVLPIISDWLARRGCFDVRAVFSRQWVKSVVFGIGPVFVILCAFVLVAVLLPHGHNVEGALAKHRQLTCWFLGKTFEQYCDNGKVSTTKTKVMEALLGGDLFSTTRPVEPYVNSPDTGLYILIYETESCEEPLLLGYSDAVSGKNSDRFALFLTGGDFRVVRMQEQTLKDILGKKVFDGKIPDVYYRPGFKDPTPRRPVDSRVN